MKDQRDATADGAGARRPAVFISHSSADFAAARELCRLLEEQGVRCWIAPRNVVPGEAYGAQIIRAIESTDAVLLLLSERSNKSRHVESEVARAFEKGKSIFPVRIAEVWPSDGLELFVTSSHWIEAWKQDLPAAAAELTAALRGETPRAAAGAAAARPRTGRVAARWARLAAVLAVLAAGAYFSMRPDIRSRVRGRLLEALRPWQPPDPPPPDPPREPAASAPVGRDSLPPRRRESADPAIVFTWIEPLGLWAGRCEISNRQFLRYRPDHWSGLFQREKLDRPDQPVVNVSHAEAAGFAAWLTGRERAAGRLEPNWEYRLPTAAEWVALARCGTGRSYPWGPKWPPAGGNLADESLSAMAWGLQYIRDYDDGHCVTCNVDAEPANEWGLRGLGGNVREWVKTDSGTRVLACGCAWNDAHAARLACDAQRPYDRAQRDVAVGFRLVCAPVP